MHHSYKNIKIRLFCLLLATSENPHEHSKYQGDIECYCFSSQKEGISLFLQSCSSLRWDSSTQTHTAFWLMKLVFNDWLCNAGPGVSHRSQFAWKPFSHSAETHLCLLSPWQLCTGKQLRGPEMRKGLCNSLTGPLVQVLEIYFLVCCNAHLLHSLDFGATNQN